MSYYQSLQPLQFPEQLKLPVLEHHGEQHESIITHYLNDQEKFTFAEQIVENLGMNNAEVQFNDTVPARFVLPARQRQSRDRTGELEG